MRNITAYSRLLDALDMLAESMIYNIVHVGGGDQQELARINELREALRANAVDRPHDQIDSATQDGVLAIYEAACRARFFTGSESSYDRFRQATDDAGVAVGSLYASGGSESWGRFPPRR